MLALCRAVLFVLGLIFMGSACSKDLNFDISSRLIDTNSKLAIELSIKNNEKEAVELYKSDLPWGNVTSTLLLVVKANRTGSVMNRQYMIDDPGPARILIEPEKVMTGELDIYRLFPDLEFERSKSNYLLFWTYRVIDAAGNTSHRNGGVYELQRKQ